MFVFVPFLTIYLNLNSLQNGTGSQLFVNSNVYIKTNSNSVINLTIIVIIVGFSLFKRDVTPCLRRTFSP